MFFFFSSRRRHTRFDCDWSSDVCSSDLISPGLRNGVNASSRTLATRRRYSIAAAGAAPSAASASAARAMALRDLIMAHLLDASKYTAAVEQRPESLRFERGLLPAQSILGEGS